MAQYEIKILREQNLVIEAPSTDEAARVAKTMVARDPALKLLGVVRLDLLGPTAPQGEAA
jgi:hypothetical protein